jgi:hypothetical protein
MKISGIFGVLFTSLIALMSIPTLANASFEVRRDPVDFRTTWVRSGDEGRYTLDRIGVDGNGWPKVLSHQTFRSAAESERAAHSAGFFKMGPVKLFAHDEASAVELRDGSVTTPLWVVRNEWSADWEMKYGEWIEKNIDRDFFVKTNQASDCADLVYSARWIFARENGLPVANRLSGTGDLFTERSVKREWMDLPTDPDWTKDRRFRAALDYLLAMTYTHSLMGDSYPVALDPATFRAGVHHLSLTEDTGHTLLIHRTDFRNPGTLPFLVLYSTLPIAVRELDEEAYFYTDQPTADTGGFLRMRWPIRTGDRVSLHDGATMPFYSLEQYAPALMTGQRSFGIAVMRKLKPTFSLLAAMRAALDGVEDMIRERVKLVEDGLKFCTNQSGGCPLASGSYEDWSTPSRDSRILAQANLISSMSSLGTADDRQQMETLYQTEFAKPVITLEGDSIPLNLVCQAFRRGLAASDPNLSVALRWGVRPEDLIEIFKARLVDGYATRSASFATGTHACVGSSSADCAPGGSAFLAENSFAVDTKLKEPSLLTSAYCQATGEPDEKCVRLRHLLATTSLTIGSATKSVGAWIDAALTLNSDPRVARALRDASGTSPYIRFEITGAREFRLRGGLAFLRDRETRKGSLWIRTPAGFLPVSLPANLAVLDADLESGRGLFARGNRVVLADVRDSGETMVAELGETPSDGRLLGKTSEGRDRLVVFTPTEWRLFEANSGGKWKEILQSGFTARAPIDPKLDQDVLVYRSGPDATKNWSIVDLKSAKPAPLSFVGSPFMGEDRPHFALAHSIYLQIVTPSVAGDVLRTLRIDRSKGTAEIAWGLQGSIVLVSDDERVAVFSDSDKALGDYYFRAPIDAEGNLGAREKLGSSYYRQKEYVMFYGGTSTAMSSFALGTDGRLTPVALGAGEEWLKHIRGDSVVVLLQNGDYAIRKVSGAATGIEDGFLGMPLEGAREAPYRYLVRAWSSVDPNAPVPPTALSLSDSRHPERFAIATGMLLGDPLVNPHEPWSAEIYVGVDSVNLDAGAVINFGDRVFWIGE